MLNIYYTQKPLKNPPKPKQSKDLEGFLVHEAIERSTRNSHLDLTRGYVGPIA